MDTIAIIPARGGSKGVPGKNIKPLAGHPLIAYSIIAALQMKSLSRVVVSTDSEEIAQISRAYGAEVPFMRPAAYATDTSVDREFLVHAMEWFETSENSVPEYFVHLRPTTPLRDPSELDAAVAFFMNAKSATSMRSAHEAHNTPYKWFELDADGFLTGIRPQDPRPEYFNLPRQAFDPVYEPNGYIDIVRASVVRKGESVHGPAMLGFVTKSVADVDTEEDFEYLEFFIGRHGSPLKAALDALVTSQPKFSKPRRDGA